MHSPFHQAFLIAMHAHAAVVRGEEPMVVHLADLMCAWQELRYSTERQLQETPHT